MNQTSGFREFAFLAQDDSLIEIKIEEIFHTDYHNYVLPCARVFSDFLCKNRNIFHNKNILELGSGTGICGIVAAKLGSKVVLTDKDEESLELARKNIVLNQVEASTAPLKWGDIDCKSRIELLPEIVIASDCFYEENDIEDVLYTVWELLEHAKAFYYAYQVRYDTFSIDGYLSQFNLRRELLKFETSIETEEEIRIYKVVSKV